jgi:hypothetical protein
VEIIQKGNGNYKPSPTDHNRSWQRPMIPVAPVQRRIGDPPRLLSRLKNVPFQAFSAVFPGINLADNAACGLRNG